MQVLYMPQFNDTDKLTYTFSGSVITATLNGVSDTFDFTGMPDGTAQSYGRNPTITSTLPTCPVVDASVVSGVLSVRLLNFIGTDASDTDKFPDWVTV